MFMTGPIHHRVAKRWVRTAQVAMLVGAVGVVPVILLGMPSAAPISVPDIKPAEPKADPKTDARAPREPGVDADAVAARFVMVANNPKPKPADHGEDGGNTPPPPPPPSVKFLGAIMEASTRAALLVVDSKQRMVWIGERIGNVELVAVERDHVMIKENGVERRLDLAPRSGPVVTAAAGAPAMNATMPPPPNASDTSGNGSGDPREQRAREMLDRIRGADGRTQTR
jgi:hypothetical protein